MAKLYIKTEKPFTEVVVKAKNNDRESIILGIKAYKESELKGIRKNLRTLTNISRLNALNTEIQELQTTSTLTPSEIEVRLDELYDELDLIQEVQDTKLNDFYKSHISYIKKASISYENDAGVVSSLIVNDTREATKVEGLWDGPDECLAALLDVYFDSPSYRTSLPNKISSTIFDINFEDERLKNS